ncbi:hypothetical protein HY251_14180, partial [bacterium]|nr:hypothetical protein [bacterium]
MGMVTGERLQSGRFGALPKLGSLVIEDEVARGPASVVYAARLAAKPGATAELQRIALKAYDPTLRFQDAQAQCFELAIDERIARTRRRDETGDLPKDRLYRATDIVRAAPASLEALGSLKATILFWGEVAHALGAAHARGAAHGHFRPAHALVVRDSRETRRTNGVEESEPEARPLIVDAGIVLTPKAAKMAPESAAL